MFKKLKEWKRKKEERKQLRETQSKLVSAFLKDYNIEYKLEKSIFTDNPFTVNIYGRPSESVKKAIFDMDYGELKEPCFGCLVYFANPKKFDTEKFSTYKNVYNCFKKSIHEVINLKKQVGRDRYIYEYLHAPGFCLDCFYAIEDKLKSDFPSLDFEVHIAPAFANDSLLVSGYC